jgi:hypothetical protein
MRVLMIIGNPWIGIAMTVAAGVLLGLLGRNILAHKRGFDIPFMVLGGLGGFLTGLFFAGLMITSLPIERETIPDDRIVYPPKRISPFLADTFRESLLVKVGRDILLYPLLEQAGQIPEPQRGTYKILHSVLVVGQPWERSQTQ